MYICIKSQDNPLTNLNTSLSFFWQLWIIWNYRYIKSLVLTILYSHNLVQNGGIVELSTDIK